MVRSIFVVLLIWAAQIVSCASADESSIRQLKGSVNHDGRYEVFGVAQDGKLYHRWQNPDHSWASWAVSAPGQFGDLDAVLAPDGREFAVGLDAGALIVRSQMWPDQGWSPNEARLGHNLLRVCVALTQDGRVEVIALGGDHKVYSIAQASTSSGLGQSDWVVRNLGGQGIKDVAAVRNGSGGLNVFALDSGGSVITLQELSPNVFSNWTSLEGHDLERLRAVSAGARGMSVFALGADQALYSRTQNGGAWTPWTQVFAAPVKDWSASQNWAGSVEVVALWGHGVQIRVQEPNGTYLAPVSLTVPQTPVTATGLTPFIAPLTVKSLSYIRGGQASLRLFVIDDAGEIYSLEHAGPSTDPWHEENWQWLGRPPISSSEPDIVAQAIKCFDKILSPQDEASVLTLLNTTLPQRLASRVSNTPLASIAKNVSFSAVCAGDQEIVGAWFGRQATPEVLSNEHLLQGGNFNFVYRINAPIINRVLQAVSDGQNKNIVLRGDKYHGLIQLKSAHFELINNHLTTPVQPDQLRVTIDGTATLVNAEGADIEASGDFILTATANFQIANLFPSSAVVSDSEPTCTVSTQVSGSGPVGKLAEILAPIAANYLDFESATSQITAVTDKICDVTQAILTTTMLPRDGTQFKKLLVNYDSIGLDPHMGLTVSSFSIPGVVDRKPTVDWTFDPTATVTLPTGRVVIGLDAATVDFTADEQYQWLLSNPSIQVTDKAGVPLSPILFGPKVFLSIPTPQPIPPNFPAGTLTLVIQDGDGIKCGDQLCSSGPKPIVLNAH